MSRKTAFSLAEILVAMAILSGGIYVVVTLLQLAQKGQKGVQNAVDFDALRGSIQMVINKKSLCDGAFWTTDNSQIAKFRLSGLPPSDRLGTIRLGDSILAQVGQKLGGGLEISKIEFEDTGVPPTVTAGEKTWVVNLIVEAKKLTDSFGAKVLTNRKNPFRLSLTTDMTGGPNQFRIKECSSLPDAVASPSPTPSAVQLGWLGNGSNQAPGGQPNRLIQDINAPSWTRVDFVGSWIAGDDGPAGGFLLKDAAGQIHASLHAATGFGRNGILIDGTPFCLNVGGTDVFCVTANGPDMLHLTATPAVSLNYVVSQD